MVVDIFSQALKSLSEGPTEEVFNVLVQQQFEIYEKEILNPDSVTKELRSSVIQLDYHPHWEKHKRLRTISYSDFQQFCRSFCEQVAIQAMAHGNIDKDHALDIVQNLLEHLRCERSENVSRFDTLTIKFSKIDRKLLSGIRIVKLIDVSRSRDDLDYFGSN